MDCGRMSAQVPAYDAENNPNVTICITAAQDVGRFVTKAIDLRQWPAEMRMCGERVLVKDLVALVQRLKGMSTFIPRHTNQILIQTLGRMFNPIQWHNPASLRSELQLASAQQDAARGTRILAHIATAEGRYDFTQANLNRAFTSIRPISFQDWFAAKWNTQAQD